MQEDDGFGADKRYDLARYEPLLTKHFVL
jgi:hypothetical protein